MNAHLAITVGLTIAVPYWTAIRTQPVPWTARAIPIVLTRDVDAAHAKSGDVLTGRTIQAVWIDGARIGAGATIAGHVLDARPFTFDPAPYAKQQPSFLSIRFDRIESGATTHDLVFCVRALAHPGDLRDARTLQHLDEHDTAGYFVQIGGDSYRSESDRVLSPEGDIVGYRRQDGVYARLLPAEYRNRSGRIDCNSTNDEQPVAVFSANACGVYGLKDVYIAENGVASGTVRLESFHHTVKVYKGSAALLQSIDRE